MFNLDVINSSTQVAPNSGVVAFNDAVKNINTEDEKKVEFSSILQETISKVNESQVIANDTVDMFIKGEDVSMHEVMIAMNEAQMSMQMLLEVRNKVVEAYQELNRLSL